MVELIGKLARKGLSPSQIGVTLRDSHGIPQVRFVSGNKILRILKSNGAHSTSLLTRSPIDAYRFFPFASPHSQLLAYCYLLGNLFVWG